MSKAEPNVRVLISRARTGETVALETLKGMYDSMSHDADCSYRHKGECDCVKNDIAMVINDKGQTVSGSLRQGG